MERLPAPTRRHTLPYLARLHGLLRRAPALADQETRSRLYTPAFLNILGQRYQISRKPHVLQPFRLPWTSPHR